MVNMLGNSKRVKTDCNLALWVGSPLQQLGLKVRQMENMRGNSKRVKLDCKLGL